MRGSKDLFLSSTDQHQGCKVPIGMVGTGQFFGGEGKKGPISLPCSLAGKGGDTALSPCVAAACPPGSGQHWGPQQPWVGCSCRRSASAEVLAAIGTSAAELVAWQHARPLPHDEQSIVSTNPDHFPDLTALPRLERHCCRARFTEMD